MASRLIGQSTQARVLRRSFLAFWSWIYRSAFAYASEFCFWGEFLKNVLHPFLATPGMAKGPNKHKRNNPLKRGCLDIGRHSIDTLSWINSQLSLRSRPEL